MNVLVAGADPRLGGIARCDRALCSPTAMLRESAFAFTKRLRTADYRAGISAPIVPPVAFGRVSIRMRLVSAKWRDLNPRLAASGAARLNQTRPHITDARIIPCMKT